MKFQSDIDIDFGDRDKALALLKHTPAGIIRDDKLVKHNTGIYVTDIPADPFVGCASIDHKVAEERGYAKLDFLNVSLYTQIKNEEHLVKLMQQDVDWARIYDEEFCKRVMHIGNHHNILMRMPEPVDSIPRMAMFLALIRPAKRHLIGESWKEISKTIWDSEEEGYQFKKSHAVAYAHLVCVHINLLCEQELSIGALTSS
jgi:DNA polymerase III alpha subunit